MTRLVFFGDSHSRGLEIEDHTALNMSFSKVNGLKSVLLQQHSYKEAVVRWHKFAAKKLDMTPLNFVYREVKSSYPHVLADRLGKDIIVHSQIASSMDFVLLQIQRLHALAEIDAERDTLVVGMCRPTRTFTLDNTRGQYDFSFEDSSGLAYDSDSENSNVWTVNKFLTDHKLLATYYSALDSIMNFAIVYKYKLILVHHFNPAYIKIGNRERNANAVFKQHCVSKVNWWLDEFCVNTYNKAKNFMFDDESKYLMNFQNGRELCGLLHADQQSNREFAEYMASNWERMAEKLENNSFN